VAAHSDTFAAFRRAILERKQVTCTYRGLQREICPHILGHSKGEEKVLAFQFAGESTSGLPPEGEWRCLRLSDVRNVQMRDGRWYSASRHRAAQTCVEDVFIDVNTAVPNQPGRR